MTDQTFYYVVLAIFLCLTACHISVQIYRQGSRHYCGQLPGVQETQPQTIRVKRQFDRKVVSFLANIGTMASVKLTTKELNSIFSQLHVVGIFLHTKTKINFDGQK